MPIHKINSKGAYTRSIILINFMEVNFMDGKMYRVYVIYCYTSKFSSIIWTSNLWMEKCIVCSEKIYPFYGCISNFFKNVRINGALIFNWCTSFKFQVICFDVSAKRILRWLYIYQRFYYFIIIIIIKFY